MSFTGFPDEGLVFYEGLEADNTKTYWTAHKGEYESTSARRCWRCWTSWPPEFGTPKVFRPYRDVRFSTDKTPYKTHQGAVVTPEGRGAGSWYVQISADGLRVSGGVLAAGDRPDRPVPARRRRRRPGCRGWSARSSDCGRPGGTSTVTAWCASPRGYPADDERIELLRHKSLHAIAGWDAGGLAAHAGGPRPGADRVAGLATLNSWLADNVGATTKEPRR